MVQSIGKMVLDEGTSDETVIEFVNGSRIRCKPFRNTVPPDVRGKTPGTICSVAFNFCNLPNCELHDVS